MPNQCYRVIAFSLLFLMFVSSAHAENVVGVGSEIRLPISATGKIAVSDGKIIKVIDTRSALKIFGKKVGRSFIRDEKGSRLINVLSSEDFEFYKLLQYQLKSMRGLDVVISDTLEVVVQGRLLRVSDWKVLSILAKRTNAKWVLNAKMEEDTANEIKREIGDELRSAKLSNSSYQVEPLEIKIADEQKALLPQYQRSIQSMGVRVLSAPQVLATEPLVRVKILVTEVRKKAFLRYGIQWPETYQAQVLPTAGQGVLPLDGLTLQLNAMEEQGEAKILASPNLLCRSGKEAEFLAGGEFPIKIANFKTQDVIWKKYGVLLKIAPKADVSGRMSIGLTTEVSMIDSSQTVDGVPGLLTNRIQSHLDLSGSKTIALSGLIKQEYGSAKAGLPLLSRIPILGALFSSQDFRDQKTELVVFVTPEVVNE